MNKRNTLVGPQLQRGRAGFNPDWKRLIAFVAVIVLGSIVATQILANSYRFRPALGFNLFHVYPPWSYFVWAHQWEQPNNRALFAQAFGIGSLVTLGGFFVLLLDVARANFRVNPFLHGSARWANLSDIKAAGLLNNDGVYVGAWRDKGGKIHYLRHAGPEHVLCYAPTRSGNPLLERVQHRPLHCVPKHLHRPGTRRRRDASANRPAVTLFGIGIEVVENHRIAEAIQRHGERFLERIFHRAKRKKRNIAASRLPTCASDQSREANLNYERGSEHAR